MRTEISDSTITCVVTDSIAGLPEGSRNHLRGFLDAADSANPFQDPLFFGARGPNEINLLLERGGRPVFFALGVETLALSRLLPRVRALVVHKGPVADDFDVLMLGLQALQALARERHLSEVRINPQIKDEKAGEVARICAAVGFLPLASPPPTHHAEGAGRL